MILGGEIHYFRVPRELWRNRLIKLRNAFFNTVTSYIAWNLHEVEPGCFDFKGEKDIEAFIEEAKRLGLYFIARPGPYICSEWDNGGHPDWLLRFEDLIPRSCEEPYWGYAERWLRIILSLISRFSIKRGGNLIAIQLENEYFWGDIPYHQKLRMVAESIGVDVDLYTNHNKFARNTSFIDTVDLYPNQWDLNPVLREIKELAESQPTFRPKIMEYEGGWFSTINSLPPTARGSFPGDWSRILLTVALAYGCDLVNIYMFHGGTNFGYWTGRWITSTYDYEAAVREWGELGERYYKFRSIAGFAYSFPYLIEASRIVEERWSDGRGLLVRENEDRSRAVFLVNNTEEDWIAEVEDLRIRVPRRNSRITVFNLDLGFTKLLHSNLDILGSFDKNLILYGDRGESFEVALERGAGFKVKGLEAREEEKRIVLRGKVSDGVIGCFIESPRASGRILIVERKIGERVWVDKSFPILSDGYMLEEANRDSISMLLKPGLTRIYLPLERAPRNISAENAESKWRFIEELKLAEIEVEVKHPNIEASIGEFETLKPIRIWITDLKHPIPLEKITPYPHGVYVYSTSIEAPDQPTEIIVPQIYDHATLILDGKPIVSGFLHLEASIPSGRHYIELIVENTGHPNDGVIPFYTGLLSPILSVRVGEVALQEWEYTIIDLSDRYKPGLATTHSHTKLVNQEIPNLLKESSNLRWNKVEGEYIRFNRRILAGILAFKAEFEVKEPAYTILELSGYPRIRSPTVILVNGLTAAKLHRVEDRNIVNISEFISQGKNEIILALPVYNLEECEIPSKWKPKISFWKNSEGRFKLEALYIWDYDKSKLKLLGDGKPTKLPLKVDEPIWMKAKLKSMKLKGVEAPLYLEIEGEVNALIFLNGRLIGRYYHGGCQHRFYLPEPYLTGDDTVNLLLIPVRHEGELEKLEVAFYYKAVKTDIKIEQ